MNIALLLMYHRGYKRLQELHWAESVFNFNHQSVPVAENSYMSTSGFVIAGDNVQAASILLSRFLSFHALCFSEFIATERKLSKDKNKIKTQESERREKDSGRAAEVEGVWDPRGKLLCLHVCLLWKRFSTHTIYF